MSLFPSVREQRQPGNGAPSEKKDWLFPIGAQPGKKMNHNFGTVSEPGKQWFHGMGTLSSDNPFLVKPTSMKSIDSNQKGLPKKKKS